MLRDEVEKYTKQKYNCSEAMLRGMNDYYHLKLDEAALKLAGGLGGGLYSGDVCGCLTGATMALGAMKINDKAKATEGFTESIQQFYESFKNEYGAVDCQTLRQTQRDPVLGCAEFIARAADFVEESLKNRVD